jgi:hypothetical protein
MSIPRRPRLALFVSALAGLWLSSSPLSAPGGRFLFGRAAFGVGAGPLAVAAGDLDGDQRTDLVVTNSDDDTISVVLGKAHATYPTGPVPTAVAVGLVDGDEHLDVAVVASNCEQGLCGPGSVSVYLGNGDGTLTVGSSFPTNTNPQDVTIGDFDGDGRPDLAVSNAITTTTQGPGTVGILLGNGDGTFQPGIEYPAGDGVGDVVAGDFDEDGALDLAVTNAVGFTTAHAAAVLLGSGDGSFAAPALHDTAHGPVSLVARDLDGDLHLDLAVVALGGNAVSVLLGTGDGTFAPSADFAAGFGPKSIAATDLDGDGDLDLAVTTFTALVRGGSVAILRAAGDGTFAPPDESMTGTIAPSLAAGDFDGDGRQDLASTDLQGSALVFRGRGDGTLHRFLSLDVGEVPSAIASGRLDGNATLDLATANLLGNSVTVTPGNGDGTFGASTEVPVGRSPIAIVAEDLDGDGDSDLATANFDDGSVSILSGNGDGTFADEAAFPAGSSPLALVAGDFDGDGVPDLVVANAGTKHVSLLPGNGDGSFAAPIESAAGPSPVSLATGDFDQDGTLDLAVAAGQVASFGPGVVNILLGRGDGTFDAPLRLFAGIDAAAVATADLDGDGILDLLVGTNLDVFGSLTVFLGLGGGAFARGNVQTTGAFTVAVLAADLDGDGRQDACALNAFSNTLTVLTGRGNGSLVRQATQDPGPGPVALTSGDFDGDGRIDLAVADQLDGTVAVLRSQ